MRVFVYRPDGSLRISVGVAPDGKLAHPVTIEQDEVMWLAYSEGMSGHPALKFNAAANAYSVDEVVLVPPLTPPRSSPFGYAL